MSLSKAYQKQEQIPEFFVYVSELTLYKAECRRNKRVPKSYETSDNPKERLVYADEKRRFREACTKFSKAQIVYRAAKARAKFGELTYEKLDRVIGLDVGATTKDLIEDAKQTAIARSVSDDEFETIRNAVLGNTPKTVRESFIADATGVRRDPTLEDFEPLPE